MNETGELLRKDKKYPHKFENQHHNNMIATKYGWNLFFLQHIKIELS